MAKKSKNRGNKGNGGHKRHDLKLQRLDEYRWALRAKDHPGMKVDGVVFGTQALIDQHLEEGALNQVANVAHLPGIVGQSMGMPDIHFGYGFPIGGVAALSADDGVISPGGVGYDINCGVRLVRTDLRLKDAKGKLDELLNECYGSVPSGVGEGGSVRLNDERLDDLCTRGSAWAVDEGYAWEEDPSHTEGGGCLTEADPSALSDRARKRAMDQVGTLGAGNHFLEIQAVDEIFDSETASAMGIDEPGQLTVMIHCGSRGFGHQVCDDFIALMQNAVKKYEIDLPDRQLGCAPVDSDEGQKYLRAMACAANYAWVNRQVIMHLVRGAFERVMGSSARKLGMGLVYDVAHNIAKIERHEIDGEKMRLCVHRKGATRAFPAGHPELPQAYREVGQPVIVPGDMGTGSYLMVGTQRGFETTYGSTCHGAGRTMSRTAAKKLRHGREIVDQLRSQGILVRGGSTAGIAEEQPEAYKDVDEVIRAVEGAGLSKPVARVRPVAVMKG